MSSHVSTAELERGAPDASADADSEREEREETISVLMTSVAAVATAWSAFQAATWSGRQTFALTRATKLRQLSSEARLEGDQQLHFDATAFLAFARDYAHGEQTFSQFLYDRFPPRLRRAMDAWLATSPLTSRDAPPHPFAMAEYRLEMHERASALGVEADDAIVAGAQANRTSDSYVLATVAFATIISLASLGTRVRRRSPRRAMLVVSAVALVGALAWLASRPIAWLGA